jgi:TonB family protein
MNPFGTERVGWTRGRFLGIVGGLFVLQTLLLLLFAERANRADSPFLPQTRFRAVDSPISENELLKTFFVGDPSVFARPSIHGFSGRAWLSGRPGPYHPTNALEAPIWLGLDVSKLGILSSATEVAARAPLLLDMAGPSAPSLEPLPVFLPAPILQTQSVFRLEGEAGRRWMGLPPPLAPQSSAQLLTNTVVEIAINAAGHVVVHRLLARSGSAAADETALAVAKSLRFAPAAAEATWGEAVFQWHTVPHTNDAAAK